jgi:hypothetical protein
MNRKYISTAAMILGGLLIGGAVEHIRMASRVPERERVEPEVVHHVQRVAVDASGDRVAQEKLIDALNARIAALTAELAQARAPQPQAGEVPSERREGERRDDRGDRGREGWEERMERMKQEEPERYAEMQKRREEFMARMEERKQSKRDFLGSVNTAGMTPEQRENYERLLALNERVNAIGELMISGQGENRDELRQEMFESLGALRDLNTLARVYLLEQTAHAAGYQGDEAALFTEHIESIIEHTTMQGPPPGIGGGGPRGGAGRGSR